MYRLLFYIIQSYFIYAHRSIPIYTDPHMVEYTKRPIRVLRQVVFTAQILNLKHKDAKQAQLQILVLISADRSI